MNTTQICFLNDNNPTFIIQDKQQSFCFYENNKTDKKAKYIAEAYRKVHSGKTHYFEISDQQESILNFGENQVVIRKIGGGYAIQVNEQKITYATKRSHDEFSETVVYAPWIDNETSSYLLAKGSIEFEY